MVAKLSPETQAGRPKVCTVCGAVLPSHARCWACGCLVGWQHADPGPLALGLCRCCRQLLSQGTLAFRQAPPPADEGEGEALLTAGQVATLLGVKRRTVAKMGADGRLPAVRLPGRSPDPRGSRLRFQRSALRELLSPRLASKVADAS